MLLREYNGSIDFYLALDVLKYRAKLAKGAENGKEVGMSAQVWWNFLGFVF